MQIQELYKPTPMAANSSYNIPDSVQAIACFLCVTSGTITVVDQAGVTIINAMPVTAGVYHPMPFYLGSGISGTVTTAGGASGVVGFA